MKLISYEQMKSEKLEWGGLIEPNEHSDFWHHEIVDGTGEVYIGVVYEDGHVETPYAVWDSVETLERFEARPILRHYSGRVTRTLHCNRETNELFGERSHRNWCDTHIYRVTGLELLEWFLDMTEDDLMQLPMTGHVCISLPAQLREEIDQIASAERRSFKDWVIERLSECARDERSRASLGQAADRGKRLRELVDRIKEGRVAQVGN